MEKDDLVRKYLRDVIKIANDLDGSRIIRLYEKISITNANNKRIFVAGNGGSSANSSHMICDLMEYIKITALSDNIPTITALANDISYEDIFSEQIRSQAEQGDLLICITGSGNSPNILKAIKTAKDKGLNVFSLLGADGGDAKKLSDDYILVSSNNYGIVEDFHLMINHIVKSLLIGSENLIKD